jgi:hypothetical protein
MNISGNEDRPMHQGEYDPARQSPFRARPHASPQYVGTQHPGYGTPPAPAHAGHFVPRGVSPPYWSPGPGAALAQSRAGVGSFALSIISGLLLVASVTAAIVINARANGAVDEKSPTMIAAGLGIILGLFMNLIGVIVGGVALTQRDRKKVLAVLGVTFNGLMLLAVGGLMVWGIVSKA